MSYDMNPPEPVYATPPNVCDLCFDVDKTPRFLLACFSGIQIGDAWIPTDFPPSNKIFSTSIIAPCDWSIPDGFFTSRYRMVAGFSVVTMISFLGPLAFSAARFGNCHLWFANSITTPIGNKYYGGWCQIVPSLTGGSWSVQELSDLISENPEWSQWLNPHPDAAENTFYNFYGGRTHSNLKIKIDHS